MFREYYNEEWKEIEIETYFNQKTQVFISNYGRVKKKNKKRDKDFKLAKLSTINNFLVFSYPTKTIHKMFCVHKMVGICFLKKTSEDQKFVIHTDYNLKNNNVTNLKFVTQQEVNKHRLSNPKFIQSRKEWTPKSKLTEGKVRIIKKKLLDPNRKTRLKLIAKQFDISVSQLYRIKIGENWGHIKI